MPPDSMSDEPWLEPSTRIVTEPVGISAVDDATAGATVMVMTSLDPTVGLDDPDVRVVAELERPAAKVVGQEFRR